jgi:hypothetical protein
MYQKLLLHAVPENNRKKLAASGLFMMYQKLLLHAVPENNRKKLTASGRSYLNICWCYFGCRIEI